MDSLPYSIPGGQQVLFTPHQISGRFGGDAQVLGTGAISSENYVTSVSGWRIDGAGNVEFESGFFRGDITGSTGSFSGALDVGGADTTSFHVDVAGNMWLGGATFAAAPFRVDASGNLVAATVTGVVGGGTFDGPELDGAATIVTGGALASDNYLTGVSGWAIGGDGDAEFNSIAIRGSLRTGTTGAYVEVGSQALSYVHWRHGGAVRVGDAYMTAQYSASPAYGVLAIVGPQQNGSAPPSVSLTHYNDDSLRIIGFQNANRLTIFDNATLQISDGSASSPGLTFRNDPSSGIYRASSTDVRLVSNGQTKIFTGSTEVGLGGTVEGISYTGTSGTGSSNNIGFKWSSPNIYGRVDNSVEAIVGTVSDRRLKKDIQPSNPADLLLRLMALQVHSFKPRPLGTEAVRDLARLGLIADEVEIVEPWAVPLTSSPEEMQTVDYLGLVPLLVGAVQELERRTRTQ